jgi:hypothetical protein
MTHLENNHTHRSLWFKFPYIHSKKKKRRYGGRMKEQKKVDRMKEGTNEKRKQAPVHPFLPIVNLIHSIQSQVQNKSSTIPGLKLAHSQSTAIWLLCRSVHLNFSY